MSETVAVKSPFGKVARLLPNGKYQLSNNDTGIRPVGHRVLVMPDMPKDKSEGGIIMATDDGLRREAMAQIVGTVLDVGPEAFKDKDAPWCKPGDRVIFAKYAGLMPREGKPYRIINDEDVVAVVEEGIYEHA